MSLSSLSNNTNYTPPSAPRPPDMSGFDLFWMLSLLPHPLLFWSHLHNKNINKCLFNLTFYKGIIKLTFLYFSLKI